MNDLANLYRIQIDRDRARREAYAKFLQQVVALASKRPWESNR